MEYKVLKTFTDKLTKKGYREGSSYESNDSERVAFLQESGFLEVPEDFKEEKQEELPPTEESAPPTEKGKSKNKKTPSKK